MKHTTTALLLGGTGRPEYEAPKTGSLLWNAQERVEKTREQVSWFVRSKWYTMGELDALSLPLWQEFVFDPNPMSATRIAEFYGFSPDLESIDMFPIMIFTSARLQAVIIYSDVTKEWWSRKVDEKVEWILPIRFFHTQPETKTFSYRSFDNPSSGSVHYFDERFVRFPIRDTDGNRVGDMQIFSESTDPHTPIPHTPVFH